MNLIENQKITARHLQRRAFLYVRQSTLRQVIEHTESTQRQYALRQRAVSLGWSDDRIVVIDCDQGKSGATTANRDGFQRLVAEVGMGNAGIVMGLEVSRLARNNVDWHRLLEICALTSTLILDEDGLYDPAHYNDRLLLGLKGTMSEAELHMLKSRLQGGKLNKARRGELRQRLPVGFVYADQGKTILDPDRQVREAISTLFATYRRTGSAGQVVRFFDNNDLKFPRRPCHGPHKGELLWSTLNHWRVLRALHNPRYAGAYFYGRKRDEASPPQALTVRAQAAEQWQILLPDAHKGYISFKEFENNRRLLRDNAQSKEPRSTPPREGPALLQGMVVCGICGERMTVSYEKRRTRCLPRYRCQSRSIQHGKPACQDLQGAAIDTAVGKLVVQAVTPLALDVSLAVQKELQQRFEQADKLRRKQGERAQYEVDLARRRYMRVDPDNRLVADDLEADWNDKLRLLRQAKEQYEQQRQTDLRILSEEERKRILALAMDFPRLWNDPTTPYREKKRMIRLLVEDVTITRDEQIRIGIRFKGGAIETLHLPIPDPVWRQRATPKEVIAEIDRLLQQHHDGEIVAILNNSDLRPGHGGHFTAGMVYWIRTKYGLKNRFDRLREQGFLTPQQIATMAGVTRGTVRKWKRKGLLHAHVYDGCGSCLFEPPKLDQILSNSRNRTSFNERTTV